MSRRNGEKTVIDRLGEACSNGDSEALQDAELVLELGAFHQTVEAKHLRRRQRWLTMLLPILKPVIRENIVDT